MTSALIVEDGSSPYVLAAVRSLGRAGFRVGVASPVSGSRVVRSKFVSTWHRARLPEHDLPGFLADVRAAVRAGRFDVVFGADDIEVLALSAHRDELGAVFPYSPHDAVLRAVDKLTLTEAAASVGMSVPRTSPATAEAVGAVTGPVVVKARLHWEPDSVSPSRHLLVALCADAASAAERVSEVEQSGGRALLQEPVHGEQLAISVVMDQDGEIAAACQQRTLMSSLARTSSRAETVPVDQDLLALVRALLRELGWFGLANLQFLRSADGAARLIDLNGRFYGSLALAVAAGADLPAVWMRLAVGSPPEPCLTGRAGVRFHALHADLVRATAQRRGGLAADVTDTLRFAPRAAHSTWQWNDAAPGMALAGSLVAGVSRRAASRLRPSAREGAPDA